MVFPMLVFVGISLTALLRVQVSNSPAKDLGYNWRHWECNYLTVTLQQVQILILLTSELAHANAIFIPLIILTARQSFMIFILPHHL